MNSLYFSLNHHEHICWMVFSLNHHEYIYKMVYTIGSFSNLLQLYKPSFLIDYDLYVKCDTYYSTSSQVGA